MGGCHPTSACFASSLDLSLQNSVSTTFAIPTDDVDVSVTGPDQVAVPAGIAPNFIVQRAGAPFPGISVTAITPLSFRVTIAAGAGALERIRYTGADPIWPNVTGGRLLAFDVPIPFP